MVQISILLDPAVVQFYSKVALEVGYPIEKVLSDALFMLAGELSLEALYRAES